MDIFKYKLYRNDKYVYVYNGFISVVRRLIKYPVITSKKAEKYKPKTIFKTRKCSIAAESHIRSHNHVNEQ